VVVSGAFWNDAKLILESRLPSAFLGRWQRGPSAILEM
jgi:hypothetical protein